MVTTALSTNTANKATTASEIKTTTNNCIENGERQYQSMTARKFSDTIHDRRQCLRHHHRTAAVAIKFKPGYDNKPPVMDLKSPPTPIAEKILKGDFSF
ncbi:hypothetical protein TRICI_004231 [Trichomonascus ciferrii]|uniref:Uncharacterized protein n=1 Tax=Trichomonascus ciferrii TaxID=44093 RepID=A0A642V0Y5_9ASCO|nr:hypothetical protein TRICI_004231 [Trichomonascus ciferrii]